MTMSLKNENSKSILTLLISAQLFSCTGSSPRAKVITKANTDPLSGDSQATNALSIAAVDTESLTVPAGSPMSVAFKVLNSGKKAIIVGLKNRPVGSNLDTSDPLAPIFSWSDTQLGEHPLTFILRDKGKCLTAKGSADASACDFTEGELLNYVPQSYDLLSTPINALVIDPGVVTPMPSQAVSQVPAAFPTAPPSVVSPNSSTGPSDEDEDEDEEDEEEDDE